MRTIRLAVAGLLLVSLTASVHAQGRRRGGGGTGGGSRAGQLSPELALVVVSFEGDLKTLEGKEFRIDQGEGQSLLFRRDKKTKYFVESKEVKAKEIPLPGRIRVDARQEPQGDMMAVKVTAISAKPVEPDEPPSLVSRPTSK